MPNRRFIVFLAAVSLLATHGALSGERRAVAAVSCLSGFVRDSNGATVAGADLDFFNASGVKLITPNDNTDATGFYSVCVLPGIYTVTVAPPVGTRLLGRQFDAVDLTGNTGVELDVTLVPGTVITGRVTDEASTAIAGVDVDVDRVGGSRVFTPGDNTDGAGDYRIVVPNGLYRFRFEPPLGSRLRGLQIDSVEVNTDTRIDAVLAAGLLLSGRVTDAVGSGIAGAEVDLRELASGRKVFLANNGTDDAGNYRVAVPAGTFELRFVPPLGSRFVSMALRPFDITNDRSFDQALESGVVLSARVLGSSGTPVAGANIDLKREPTGENVFIANDETGADGRTVIAVSPGTYTIEIDPPPGSLFDQLVVPGVALSADRAMQFTLPDVARVFVTGSVVDSLATGIGGVSIEAARLPAGTAVFVENNVTAPDGSFRIGIPAGVYDIVFAPEPTSRFVAVRVANMAIARDTTWSAVSLGRGVRVGLRIQDEIGRPVHDVDVDFVSETSGREIVTPSDDSNADGSASVVVPADRYTIRFDAPATARIADGELRGVVVANDTTIVFTGNAPAKSETGSLLPAFPNPFSRNSTIPFQLSAPGRARIRIYDVRGALVRTIVDETRPAGLQDANWDGTDRDGRAVAGGIYFVRLEAEAVVATRKLLLIR